MAQTFCLMAHSWTIFQFDSKKCLFYFKNVINCLGIYSFQHCNFHFIFYTFLILSKLLEQCLGKPCFCTIFIIKTRNEKTKLEILARYNIFVCFSLVCHIDTYMDSLKTYLYSKITYFTYALWKILYLCYAYRRN